MAKTRTGFEKGDARYLKGTAHENFTQGQKEHVEKMSKVVGKESAGKIGHYAESTGGGTPIPKGEKLENHPEAKRVQQPRDEEGKFTYNSVNLKDLKYGPSRGDTVPPFLRGVKMTYAKKVSNRTVSGGKVYNNNLDMTYDEFVDDLKRFYGEEGGFLGIVNAKIEAKRGRRSKQEKDMISMGYEGFVDSMTDFKREFKNKKPKRNKYAKKTKQDGGETPNNNNKTDGAGVQDNPQNQNSKPKPVSQTSINDEDVEMAKNNPEQFLDKYDKEIKEVVELAKSKNFKGINVRSLANLVGQGKKDVFEKLKAKLNSM